VEDSRATRLERLRSQRFDLLVVGGGIIGAGVVELAARHGFAVGLVERDDFASGTSSASSKLIHGGLRYLRMGHFGLVREALDEVRALSEVVAPHLVRPLRFVLPIYRGGPYGRIPIRGALWSYAGLNGAIAERGRMISPAAAAGLVPPLRRDGLRAAGLYADAQTDDARLTLANLRGAAEAGAVVVNRAELVGLGDGPVAEVQADGDLVDVAARAVVNATGAWIDEVRRLEHPTAGTSVTLSKARIWCLREATTGRPRSRSRSRLHGSSSRPPGAGALLLGTTDAPFDSDLCDVLPTEAEEQQILDEVGQSITASTAARAHSPGLRTRTWRRTRCRDAAQIFRRRSRDDSRRRTGRSRKRRSTQGRWIHSRKTSSRPRRRCCTRATGSGR
jgi:glycerol-3-phosphate dehydrogenase